MRYQVVDGAGDTVGRHGCIVARRDGGLNQKRGESERRTLCAQLILVGSLDKGTTMLGQGRAARRDRRD